MQIPWVCLYRHRLEQPDMRWREFVFESTLLDRLIIGSVMMLSYFLVSFGVWVLWG